MRGALLGLLASLLPACSDSQLYRGSDVVFQNDRLALTGRFCSVDPAQQRFPVKILFLVDTSPTMQALDPEYNYARAVGDIVERYVNSTLGNYTFGIIGYGGRAQLLSGGPGGLPFTRQPDLLQNAVQLLRLPEPCQGTRCRDMQGALSLASSLITGDVFASSKGEVARTRYVVVHFAGGAPTPRITKCQCGDVTRDPMCLMPPAISDQECERTIYLKQLNDVIDQIRAAGAKELRYHTFYLRDLKVTPQPPHDEVIELLQRLSSAGNGAFDCRSATDLPNCDMSFPAPRSAMAEQQYQSCRRQNMLCPAGVTSFLGFGLESAQRPFLVKKLIVSNINVVPGAAGPQLDSDADGLTDAEELVLGTQPDNADSDGDGISDLVEARLALSAVKADLPPAACFDIDFSQVATAPLADTDGDLLNDCEERLLGTDPTLADTDGDGIPDGLELRFGTNYLLSDYLIPPYDHDGIDNGDEVREHTAPRADDTMDALGFAYHYAEDNEGVKSLPYASQPRDVTGVTILDVSAGSTPGAASLRFTAAPPDCDKAFPAPRAPGDEAQYERCRACPTCPTLAWKDAGDCDFGPEFLVDVDEVRKTGGVSLTLDSRSVKGMCTVVGQPMPGAMRDFRLVARIENAAILRKTTTQETIVVGTALRACERYQVRNIKLLTPMPDRTVGREERKNGINNVYVYFGQAPDGQLTAPGIFSTALVRVRFSPPQRRDPADPEIVLQQDDFVVLGGP